nr:MAG TPA: hypothetical protein [Caudoviricetes sp.]
MYLATGLSLNNWTVFIKLLKTRPCALSMLCTDF